MKTALIKVWSQCNKRARYCGLRALVIEKELKHGTVIRNKIRSPTLWYYGPDDALFQPFSTRANTACGCKASETLCVNAIQNDLYLHISKYIYCHL